MENKEANAMKFREVVLEMIWTGYKKTGPLRSFGGKR